MKALVLLNGAAGTLASSATRDENRRIITRFARHGIEADVRHIPPEELAQAAAGAARDGYEIVVAGGGDGTINAVGSALICSGQTFGILPLGTMNQLATELRMPEDLEAAVDALATAQVTDFNVGEVNGRVFLSFSAVGLYSEIIKHRDTQRRVLQRKKWPAMVVSVLKMFTRFPVFRFHLHLADRVIKRYTPAVFVTLNEHQIRLFGVEDYSCSGRASLNVYVANERRRLGLLWLLLRGFLGLLRPKGDFEAMCVSEIEIATRRRHLRVALDGEVIDMATPLRYRLISAGLRMLVPQQARPEAGKDLRELHREAEGMLKAP